MLNNFNVEEFKNYINIIFKLQGESLDKDFRIAKLEFELAMERKMLEDLKNTEKLLDSLE